MTALQCLWAVVFGALGLWGAHATAHWYKPKGLWAPARKRIFACCLLVTGGCVLVVAGLIANRLRGWMFAPLGISYSGLLFLPCYFRVVNRVKIVLVARNVLFAAIAILCFAIVAGIVPLSWFGV